MTPARGVVVGLAVLVALVLQASVLPLLSGGTLVPNLCLLVAIAVGISTGETPGMVTGFIAGLALDLTPPAEHLAGRWALALLVAGFLAGRLATGTTMRATRRAGPRATPGVDSHVASPPTLRDRAGSLGRIAALGAAASFVATSILALSGLIFGELEWAVPELWRALGSAVLVDAAAAVVVVPVVVRAMGLRVPGGAVPPLTASPPTASPEAAGDRVTSA